MQDINNVSDTDIKPSPLPDTTFAVADDRTLSPDDTNSDMLRMRADNHTGCLMLKFIINEPGPNRVYGVIDEVMVPERKPMFYP